MAGQVRSGFLDPTRPDPTRQGLDPTRPAVLVHIPDPTRPNPTRPAGRPDPGTTLRPTEIMVDLVKVMTSYYYAQAKVLIARTGDQCEKKEMFTKCFERE